LTALVSTNLEDGIYILTPPADARYTIPATVS